MLSEFNLSKINDRDIVAVICQNSSNLSRKNTTEYNVVRRILYSKQYIPIGCVVGCDDNDQCLKNVIPSSYFHTSGKRVSSDLLRRQESVLKKQANVSEFGERIFGKHLLENDVARMQYDYYDVLNDDISAFFIAIVKEKQPWHEFRNVLMVGRVRHIFRLVICNAFVHPTRISANYYFITKETCQLYQEKVFTLLTEEGMRVEKEEFVNAIGTNECTVFCRNTSDQLFKFVCTPSKQFLMGHKKYWRTHESAKKQTGYEDEDWHKKTCYGALCLQKDDRRITSHKRKRTSRDYFYGKTYRTRESFKTAYKNGNFVEAVSQRIYAQRHEIPLPFSQSNNDVLSQFMRAALRGVHISYAMFSLPSAPLCKKIHQQTFVEQILLRVLFEEYRGKFERIALNFEKEKFLTNNLLIRCVEFSQDCLKISSSVQKKLEKIFR